MDWEFDNMTAPSCRAALIDMKQHQRPSRHLTSEQMAKAKKLENLCLSQKR